MENKNDESVINYLSQSECQTTKIILQANSLEHLHKLSEKLKNGGFLHSSWFEQPENILTAIDFHIMKFRIQKRFIGDVNELLKIPVFKLNITNFNEGYIENIFNSDKYSHLITMKPIERDIFRYYKFKPAVKLSCQSDIASVVYSKDRIKDLLPGYPIDPDFCRFLPTEVNSLMQDNKTILLDVRHNWERRVSSFKSKVLLVDDIEKFESFSHLYSWGSYKELEKLLPTEFRNRNLSFVCFCGNGDFSELFCALLYANGWKNASVMLGGINGFYSTVKESEFFDHKKNLIYDPNIDLERSIILDLNEKSTNDIDKIFVLENKDI